MVKAYRMISANDVELDLIAVQQLWSTVISSAIKDLRSGNYEHVLDAAQYLFTEANNDNLLTFNGACRAVGFDPDTTAKNIWNKLAPERQVYIKSLLTNGVVRTKRRYRRKVVH